MKDKRRILIIHRAQFGYHTDVYKWCEYLSRIYYVSTVSFFDGKPLVFLKDVKNHYVKAVFKNRLVRGLSFLLSCIYRLSFFRGTVILCYFPGCKLLGRLFRNRRIILDFRTMSVNPDPYVRDRENNRIVNTAQSFRNITAISEGVAKQLKVDERRVSILPLGADIICDDNKSFESLRLLYIGTFEYRDLEKTILGIKKVVDEMPDCLLTYDIIGQGRYGERQKYEQLVSTLHLDKVVRIHGYIQHEKLHEYFEKCNIGVSFVPLTDYFEYQPVTKTFEYALSGLFTIATDTQGNRDVITQENGILIKDTPADAICRIAQTKDSIDSSAIRESMKEYQWESIVQNVMIPILVSVQ